MSTLTINQETMTQFRDSMLRKNLAKQTQEKYERYVIWFAQDQGKITPESVNAWIDRMLMERKWTLRTANTAIAALNYFFRANDRKDLAVPSRATPEVEFTDEDRYLTQGEFNRLYSTAVRLGWRMAAAILLALRSTGVRVSELRFFTVEGVKAGRILVYNKGKYREVLIDSRTRKELKQYCQMAGVKEGPVFVTRTGTALSRNNIWRLLKRVAREAGVDPKKVFPHNVRHLAAVELYRACKDLNTVRLFLGHSNTRVTQIYLRVTVTEFVKQLDRYCWLRKEVGAA